MFDQSVAAFPPVWLDMAVIMFVTMSMTVCPSWLTVVVVTVAVPVASLMTVTPGCPCAWVPAARLSFHCRLQDHKPASKSKNPTPKTHPPTITTPLPEAANIAMSMMPTPIMKNPKNDRQMPRIAFCGVPPDPRPMMVEVPDVMPVASTVTVAGSSAVPPGPSPAGPSSATPPLTLPHRESLNVAVVIVLVSTTLVATTCRGRQLFTTLEVLF
uniref:Uncharacterized protein n=1 Tax=Branchiostoma floridae TaxID=7739 RepID=C3YWK9_BRAFL|eukprot:XP_002599241.1 hypothetical protein BRAFLDRAFT_117382 [Branchiostoma floridae]